MRNARISAAALSALGFVFSLAGLLFFSSPARSDPPQKGPDYQWDESKNPLGRGRCSSAMQCDGERFCTPAGWCQGTARRPVGGPPRKTPDYQWDESKNPLGRGRCSTAMQCDGERICTAAGWCQGKPR